MLGPELGAGGKEGDEGVGGRLWEELVVEMRQVRHVEFRDV